MKEHHYGIDYDVEGAFPARYELPRYEGTDVWLAEQEESFFVIIDERHHAKGLKADDPMDREILANVVKVMEFASEDERRSWLKLQLGE